jgi:hypothetical protein
MFHDLSWVVQKEVVREIFRVKEPSMTNPESIQQDTELNPGSSTEEEAGIKEGLPDEGVTADYQERLREFDAVESVPVVSVPVQSSELSDSDLKVQAPGDQNA